MARMKPKVACKHPMCPALIDAGETYCEAHKREAKKDDWRISDDRRESAAKRGYDGKWRKAREGYLAHHPLCEECLRNGEVTAASVVDHIVPHRGDKAIFWDSDNWQALCKPCHDKKTFAGK